MDNSTTSNSIGSAAIKDLLIDGYGGAVSSYPIALPLNYEVETTPNISLVDPKYTNYAQIDAFAFEVSTTAALSMALLSLSILTFVYIMALTPTRKRCLPIFYLISSGSFTGIMRFAANFWIDTHSFYAASYVILTNDVDGVTYSREFIAICCLCQITAVLAFGCVQGALFAQARCLLLSVNMKYGRYAYISLLITLCILGLAATVLRCSTAAWQLWVLFDDLDTNQLVLSKDLEMLSQDAFLKLGRASSVVATVSILAWTSCFVGGALGLLRTKRSLLFWKDHDRTLAGNPRAWLESAMATIIMVGTQNMVIPIIFCVLSLVPQFELQTQFEKCIVPSVLCLLPIGSLFLNRDCDCNATHGSSTGVDNPARLEDGPSSSMIRCSNASSHIHNADCQNCTESSVVPLRAYAGNGLKELDSNRTLSPNADRIALAQASPCTHSTTSKRAGTRIG